VKYIFKVTWDVCTLLLATATKNIKEMPVFVSENNSYKKRLNIECNAFTFLSREGTSAEGRRQGSHAAGLRVHPRDF